MSRRLTKGAHWLFAGPTSTKKKLCGNFPTPFYAKVDKDLTPTNQQIVKSTINELIVKQDLPATATNLIITTPTTSCIYFLPKIHKPNNPGRPIVSACSCPTELISSYLDKIMAPIVRSLPSYVKDSQHTLQIFCDFNFLGEDKLIFTMDITSLYTVIPNGEGLLALKHFFDLRTVKVPMKEFFFSRKYRHLGAENQKIQEKFARKVLKRNPRVSKIQNLL